MVCQITLTGACWQGFGPTSEREGAGPIRWRSRPRMRLHPYATNREHADRAAVCGRSTALAQSCPHQPHKSLVGDWGFSTNGFCGPLSGNSEIHTAWKMSHATPMLDGTVLECGIGVGWARPYLRLARMAPLVAWAKLLGDPSMMPPTATRPALTFPQPARPKGSEPAIELAFELSSRRLLGNGRCRRLDVSTGRASGEIATEPVSWPSATIIL